MMKQLVAIGYYWLLATMKHCKSWDKRSSNWCQFLPSAWRTMEESDLNDLSKLKLEELSGHKVSAWELSGLVIAS